VESELEALPGGSGKEKGKIQKRIRKEAGRNLEVEGQDVEMTLQ